MTALEALRLSRRAPQMARRRRAHQRWPARARRRKERLRRLT